MQDRTACQRWASDDKRPGSMYHEILALPTFMPGEARQYALPGTQPGASGLDEFEWGPDFVQAMRNAQGLCPYPIPLPSYSHR